eukprot:m.49314 g.49314  ORF g.49314 m.49314 type:complete len:258 (+) comp47927_c0_seq1:132-905(+)
MSAVHHCLRSLRVPARRLVSHARPVLHARPHIPTDFDLESRVLAPNRAWAASVHRDKPGFLERLQKQQTPDYLWIGCSDSRVPANVIVDMDPGEVFVHRNYANLVQQTDFNCLSVLQYSVDALKVKHILVVGHYGCGGVRAALEDTQQGLVDTWLRPIQFIARFQKVELAPFGSDIEALTNKLCEINVIRQALNVGQTTVVQDAWRRGQALSVHGLIYGLQDGLLKDLKVTMTSYDDVVQYEKAYALRGRDAKYESA